MLTRNSLRKQHLTANNQQSILSFKKMSKIMKLTRNLEKMEKTIRNRKFKNYKLDPYRKIERQGALLGLICLQ